MDDRSRAVFRRLVETYLETGDPVGSQKLSRDDAIGASSATVRNVLANLTEMGLLQAPHISAGRLPTEHGLRLFVDGMLQVGELSPAERQAIEPVARDENIDQLLQRAAARLSGLTQSASLVMTNVHEAPLRQIEFVSAGPGKAVVITVGEDGHVENRIIDVPADLPPSSFVEAANYLNARLRGQNLAQARANILAETEAKQADLDALTSDLVQRGIAKITDGEDWSLIVRGQGHLLNETAVEDLERVRQLFDDLERKRDVVDLLDGGPTRRRGQRSLSALRTSCFHSRARL